MLLYLATFAISLFLISSSLAANKEPVDYVNPFIGTDAHGHTYPGATVPFGMVQLSPESGNRGWDWCSGYHYSDTVLVGFSHLHLSGTGCADLGDVMFMPLVEAANTVQSSRFAHEQEQAEPGYYSVRLLDSDIHVELTATERTGIHRYTYPLNAKRLLSIDLGSGNEDTPLACSLWVESSTRVSGLRRSAGWAKDQWVYFAAEFSQPILRVDNTTPPNGGATQMQLSGKTIRTLLEFAPAGEPLIVKVGISAVSAVAARRNLGTEAPGWNFDGYRRAARDTWNRELNRIIVETKSNADKETFYTALYHTFLAPTLYCDADGAYRGGDGQIQQSRTFDNYCTFSLWDTYRAAHPLYTIVQPQRVPDMVNSMLAFQRETGLLPVWSLQGCETWCMIGYHSVPVIADAYLKGFTGFDPNAALTAMQKSAIQNRRGLEFYNLVTPEPLEQKLAQLNANRIVIPESLRRGAVSGTQVLRGYAKSVSGETIHYHSSYPYVKDALLARATDGKMMIEWQTESVPSELSADTATFMWVAGLCTFRGGHRFDLYGNDDLWLSFNSARDTTEKSWSVSGANGTTLTFLPTYLDVYDDFFGEAYLNVPAKLLKKGEPLTLRVVGENGGSSDWYMTFEHVPQDTMVFVQEYALAESNGQKLQFMRVLVESLQEWPLHDISMSGTPGNRIETRIIRPGLTNLLLPINAVTEPRATDVKVQVINAKKAVDDLWKLSLMLQPVVPYCYIPADKEHESVSKTLEYAFDDWCIARMAEAMGESADAKTFYGRSGYFKNLYDPSTGFMRGRNSDGSWVSPFDPRFGTQKQPEYTEGNAWQYTWYVPHAVPEFVNLMGGQPAFAEKLDELFNQSSDLEGTGVTADVSGLIGLYAHGNEPSHHISYLYNYCDQPWKTQEMVRRICREFYTNQPDGLCGNEDCGQMSAWYIFSALGFYPLNPCDQKYQLGSPLLPRAVLHLDNGKEFEIVAEKVSDKNIFVQSVALNGVTLDRLWITHDEIMKGGTLTFRMGSQPNPLAFGDKDPQRSN